MIEYVVDTSAVMADLHAEPGGDIARAAMKKACISAANYTEVITNLIEQGVSARQAEDVIERLGCELAEIDKYRALSAGALHQQTRRSGVSLGDRYCLALAAELGLPVLTTDQRWATLNLGIEVRLIR